MCSKHLNNKSLRPTHDRTSYDINLYIFPLASVIYNIFIIYTDTYRKQPAL